MINKVTLLFLIICILFLTSCPTDVKNGEDGKDGSPGVNGLDAIISDVGFTESNQILYEGDIKFEWTNINLENYFNTKSIIGLKIENTGDSSFAIVINSFSDTYTEDDLHLLLPGGQTEFLMFTSDVPDVYWKCLCFPSTIRITLIGYLKIS
jgi:hypothetical protein